MPHAGLLSPMAESRQATDEAYAPGFVAVDFAPKSLRDN